MDKYVVISKPSSLITIAFFNNCILYRAGHFSNKNSHAVIVLRYIFHLTPCTYWISHMHALNPPSNPIQQEDRRKDKLCDYDWPITLQYKQILKTQSKTSTFYLKEKKYFEASLYFHKNPQFDCISKIFVETKKFKYFLHMIVIITI